MERLFDLANTRISRRRMLQGGLQLVVGFGAAVGCAVEGTMEDTKRAERELAWDNFDKILKWMKYSGHPQIRGAAKKLNDLQTQTRSDNPKIDFIVSDTFRTESVIVSTFSSVNGPEAIIVLSLKKFARADFPIEGTAKSLFKAYHIYQKAKQEPQKYAQDAHFRQSLEERAEQITNDIFSQNGTD